MREGEAGDAGDAGVHAGRERPRNAAPGRTDLHRGAAGIRQTLRNSSATESPVRIRQVLRADRARAVGLDAAQFAGHSLRAGFVTSAVRAGKSIPKVMEQTGHRGANTVMAYVREADRWRDPASGGGSDCRRLNVSLSKRLNVQTLYSLNHGYLGIRRLSGARAAQRWFRTACR